MAVQLRDDSINHHRLYFDKIIIRKNADDNCELDIIQTNTVMVKLGCSKTFMRVMANQILQQT
jgi:hypothetical protein